LSFFEEEACNKKSKWKNVEKVNKTDGCAEWKNNASLFPAKSVGKKENANVKRINAVYIFALNMRRIEIALMIGLEVLRTISRNYGLQNVNKGSKEKNTIDNIRLPLELLLLKRGSVQYLNKNVSGVH